MSYQSSICESFERIVQDWVNSSAGPTPPPCFDLLIGTNPGPGGERFTYLRAQNGKEIKIATKESFVYATGGGYFFTPSISAIRNVLAR